MKIKNKNRSGQSLVEYALIFALLALVSIAVLTGMGKNVTGVLYDGISNNLSTANTSINNRTQ